MRHMYVASMRIFLGGALSWGAWPLLRQVKARVKRLKRLPAGNANILYNDAEESKERVPQRYDKTYLTKIVLENSFQASRDIPWIMTSQNLFSQTGQGCLTSA